MTSSFVEVPRRAVLKRLLLLSCASIHWHGELQAQQTERIPGAIQGRVIELQSGEGIPSATIRLLDVDRPPALTDAEGRFRLTGVPVGVQEIEVTHIAYGRTTHLVNVPEGVTVELDIRLGFSAIVLDSLVAEVEVVPGSLLRSGFYERLRGARGRFFHGEDTERWTPEQLLRMVSGVREVQSGRSMFDRRITMRVRSALGGDCFPDIYLDGVHYRGFEGDLNRVVGGQPIAAMEVYRGSEAPPQFTGLRYPPCGAVVMWTRRE
jgi:hypothetical protein